MTCVSHAINRKIYLKEKKNRNELSAEEAVHDRIEMEEGYNEIMEKVLRRLEKNNLYIKPEKYMWKVKKVLESQLQVGIKPTTFYQR